ncbi:MAG: EF-hand domain-containing protein [Candidatus Thiodiazotropha sp.]|jgi:Ca2+-binding EF-hand superfamily protein
MIMKQTIVAIAAAGFFTVATAGDASAFTKLDTDGDGYISAEESTVDKALYNGWAKIDANADGKVDAAEFSAFEISTPPLTK